MEQLVIWLIFGTFSLVMLLEAISVLRKLVRTLRNPTRTNIDELDLCTRRYSQQKRRYASMQQAAFRAILYLVILIGLCVFAVFYYLL